MLLRSIVCIFCGFFSFSLSLFDKYFHQNTGNTVFLLFYNFWWRGEIVDTFYCLRKIVKMLEWRWEIWWSVVSRCFLRCKGHGKTNLRKIFLFKREINVQNLIFSSKFELQTFLIKSRLQLQALKAYNHVIETSSFCPNLSPSFQQKNQTIIAQTKRDHADIFW